MDGSRPSADGKGHVRNKSSTKSTRPRSSTKGPLDVDDSPLTSPATALRSQTAAAIAAAAASSPLSPLSPPPHTVSVHGLTPSRYTSSRRRSPGPPPPGSPMSQASSNNPQQSPPPSRGSGGAGGGLRLSIDARSLGSGASAAGSTAPAPSPRPKDFSYLLRPEIYHPLPATAAAGANVPQPFRTSDRQPNPDSVTTTTSLSDLLAAGHFRAAAIVAAQQLTTATPDPTDHARIFSLLYTRLACLLLIDATALAAQEAKALEDLNSAFYRDDSNAEPASYLVPWALRVLHVRLQALGFGDPRRAVMSYYELAREARARIATALAGHDNSARELWKGRLAELGIKVAGALIEMDDMAGAAAHLESMTAGAGAGPGDVSGNLSMVAVRTPAMRRIEMAKALLWLQLGDVDQARASMGLAATAEKTATHGSTPRGNEGGDLAPRVVAALCDMADGEYKTALVSWRELREDAPDDEMVGVNLAVCLLYAGQMQEGRSVLESLVDAGYSSHTLLFNLSTMYELCTDRAKALKLDLAQRVADMEPSVQGWEKTNADFKL